ncbi:MAG: hypothetical protein R3B57_02615 [Phycisphaerales bacterium]
MQEAFDELLGRRVMFVARGFHTPEPDGGEAPPHWAVVTSISPRGEKLVRDRLRPAPRAKIAGQPILAAEHGRFLLALVERLDDRAKPTTELILCPDESAALLEDLVLTRVDAVKGAPRPVLGTQKEFALTRQLPPGDVLAAVRMLSPGASKTFVAGSASSTERGWRLSLAFEAPSWCDASKDRSINPAAMAALQDGALALIADSLPPPPSPEGTPETIVWPMQLALPGDLAAILTDRTVLRLDRAPQGAGAPLRLVIASETPDGPDRAAAVDRAISSILESHDAAQAPEGMIEGEFPRAVRTRRITLPFQTPLGSDILASWCLGFAPGDRGAEPTWWAMGLSPGAADSASASEATRLVASCLAGAPSAPEAPIAVGVVRPRSLYEAISGQPWALIPPTPALRWMELVRWRFFAPPRGDGPDRDGLVRGQVDIEMNAAALDTPATPDPGVP